MHQRVFWVVVIFFCVTLSSHAQDVLPLGADKGVDQEKINKAIEKGVEWLKKQQKPDGGFPSIRHGGRDYEAIYPGGTTALALLTLLKSGVPRKDDCIVKGFEYLKTKTTLLNPAEKDKTYCVAFLILALEAMNDPEGKEDSKTTVGGKNLKGDEKSWMARLHQWLLDHKTEYETNLDGQGKEMAKPGVKSSTGTSSKFTCIAWGYPNPAPSYDNSNNQIAILALKACDRCGIKTSKTIWQGIMNHFIRLQEQDGPKINRVGIDDAGGTTDVETEDRSRGFPYRGSELGSAQHATASSSMTCAGIGSLIIARSEFIKDSSYQKSYGPTVDAAVRDGLAWMSVHFPINTEKNQKVAAPPPPPAPAAPAQPPQNNRFGGRQQQPAAKPDLPYYLLYSIERVGAFAKVSNIGHHLWYSEGAIKIVDAQGAEGWWGNDEDSRISSTCFALLFLKRATFIVTGESYEERIKK